MKARKIAYVALVAICLMYLAGYVWIRQKYGIEDTKLTLIYTKRGWIYRVFYPLMRIDHALTGHVMAVTGYDEDDNVQDFHT